MPFPAGATTITVTGTFPLPAGGAAQTGTVVFTPSAVLADSTQHAIYSGAGTATLDTNGTFSIELLCTDDTDVQPAGWRWRVDEQIPGGRRTYWIDLPSTLGATVDLSELAPVSSPGGTGQSLPPTGPAGGALDGAYPNPVLATATIALFDAAGDAAAAQSAAVAAAAADATAKVAAHAAAVDPHGDRAYGDATFATIVVVNGVISDVSQLDGFVQDCLTRVSAIEQGTAFLAALNVAGDAQIANGNLTVTDFAKGYRFRIDGSSLDLEATGSDLIVSNWSGSGFNGTQYSFIRLAANALAAQIAGKIEFVDGLYGTARHTLDGTANQAGFYGATPVGRQAVTGSRTDGTALQSLLTALHTLGLIDDQTTA
ncbi:hypothetical protein [Streptomyces sp. bgisy154]|uniref:hypothetical protein n=1 Tax=Streptomyces sp. bgisy154 TaxID=3413794 RepID=UPI003D742B7C